MNTLSRWMTPAIVSLGIGLAALTVPPAARAGDDDLARVIVDIADVVLRGGVPYYRYGGYGYDDRLIVGRDRYGRPVYYRQVPRYYGGGRYYDDDHRYGRKVKCNSRGKCTITYYDPRYDRHGRRYVDDYRHYDRRDYDRYRFDPYRYDRRW